MVNSWRQVVRRRVHQGLNLAQGQDQWVEDSIVEVRTFRAEEDQRSSYLGEGEIRGGGDLPSFKFG